MKISVLKNRVTRIAEAMGGEVAPWTIANTGSMYSTITIDDCMHRVRISDHPSAPNYLDIDLHTIDKPSNKQIIQAIVGATAWTKKRRELERCFES